MSRDYLTVSEFKVLSFDFVVQGWRSGEWEVGRERDEGGYAARRKKAPRTRQFVGLSE
jgi:hypothetical protein